MLARQAGTAGVAASAAILSTRVRGSLEQRQSVGERAEKIEKVMQNDAI